MLFFTDSSTIHGYSPDPMTSQWTPRPRTPRPATHGVAHVPVRHVLPGRLLLGSLLLGSLLLGGLLLAGCSLFDDGSADDRRVRAYVQNEALVVENSRSDSVWVFAAETRLLSRLSLAPPSLDGDPVPPRSTREIGLSDITGDDPESSITVFWWRAVIEDGRRVAGPRSSFEVDL